MDAVNLGTWRDLLTAGLEAAAVILPILAAALILVVQLAPRLLIPPTERPADRRYPARQVAP